MNTSIQDSYPDSSTWSYEIFESAQRSRRIAWIVAALASAIALLSTSSLAMVLALKKNSPPVIVKVHQETGFTEVETNVTPGDLSEDEALSIHHIVEYVKSRETYDPTDLHERFRYVTLNSADTALTHYHSLWAPDSPENPGKLYGYEAKISVEIKNVSFLSKSKKTAQTRFITRLTDTFGRTVIDHWVAIIAF